MYSKCIALNYILSPDVTNASLLCVNFQCLDEISSTVLSNGQIFAAENAQDFSSRIVSTFRHE